MNMKEIEAYVRKKVVENHWGCKELTTYGIVWDIRRAMLINYEDYTYRAFNSLRRLACKILNEMTKEGLLEHKPRSIYWWYK